LNNTFFLLSPQFQWKKKLAKLKAATRLRAAMRIAKISTRFAINNTSTNNDSARIIGEVNGNQIDEDED
jgi:hypothetical protein